MHNNRWQLYTCCSNVFGVTAFVLTTISYFRCNLIRFPSTIGSPPIHRHFGLWWYGKQTEIATDFSGHLEFLIEEQCSPYPASADIDATWIAARAFATLTLVGGLLWLSFEFFRSCAHGTIDPVPIWMGYILLLTAFFSALTLIAFGSNVCKNNEMLSTDPIDGYAFSDQCEIAMGAVLVVLATVCWFVTSLCSLAAIRSKNKYEESARSDTMEPLIWEGP